MHAMQSLELERGGVAPAFSFFMNTAKRIIAESQEALSKVGVPETHVYYLNGRLSAAMDAELPLAQAIAQLRWILAATPEDVEQWRNGDAAARFVATLEVAEGAQSLLSLLADLTDTDPCQFDHHGYCQAHGWMATKPSCPHGRAKAILDAEREAQ